MSIDPMEIDRFVMDCLCTRTANTCPEIALKWMEFCEIRYTESTYHNTLKKFNNRMRSLEKFGCVRYTGRTVSRSDRSKIWEAIV